MVLFQKEAVVFALAEVSLHDPGDQGKDRLELRVGHPGGEGFRQGVIRKLLEIVDKRLFVGGPVETKPHEPGVGFDKLV